MKKSRLLLTVCLVVSLWLIVRQPTLTLASAAQSASQQSPRQASQNSGRHRLADSADAKFAYIEQNGAKSQPDSTPTILSEDEINDYLASGRVQIPQGVKKVRLQGQSGKVTAFLTVDFDQLRENQRSSNPFMSLFSGTHDVTVETDAAGSGGQGKVHVRTVSLDGTEIPRMALQFFVERYLTPKYPNVGLDSQFNLPNRIDAATVAYHKISLVQK
jgi:hypothetical protein